MIIEFINFKNYLINLINFFILINILKILFIYLSTRIDSTSEPAHGGGAFQKPIVLLILTWLS